MQAEFKNELALSSAGSPAKAFWRLGWISFWAQIGFGSLPVILAVYAVIFGRNTGVGTRAGNPFIGYLTFAVWHSPRFGPTDTRGLGSN